MKQDPAVREYLSRIGKKGGSKSSPKKAESCKKNAIAGWAKRKAAQQEKGKQ